MSDINRLQAIPDVQIDDNGTFKYIQIKVYTNDGKNEKVIVRGDGSCEYHADIYDKVSPGIIAIGLDTEPNGGGRIQHNRTDKSLFVYGYSMGYGRSNHELTVEKLQKAYPDYNIKFSNEARDSKGPADEFHQTLSHLGDITSIPVLTFEFVISDLTIELQNISKLHGLVLTSQRAVEAVGKSLVNKTIFIENKLCYALGQKTGSKAKELGFHVEGMDCENAEELANYICNKKEEDMKNKYLLFPCAQMKRDILPQILKENEIPLKALTVYETKPHPNFSLNLEKYLNEILSDELVILVFFSPSGVMFAKNTLQKFSEMTSLKIAAIGKTTGAAVTKNGFTLSATAEHPTPAGLLSSINDLTSNI